MKTLVAVLALAVSVNAFAKGSSHTSDKDSSEGASIITPDVATDGYQTSRFARTAAGDTVICPQHIVDYVYKDNVCRDAQGNNAWRLFKDAVPTGKTFVGFRLINSNGYSYYQIFWK